MSIYHLLLASTLGIIGLALIGYILYALLSSVAPNLRGLPERLVLKRKQKSLSEADSLLDKESLSLALPILNSSLILDHIRTSQQMIDTCCSHNMAVVARFLTVADAGSQHISSIAVIEDLLATRQVLLKSYFEVNENSKKATIRRSSNTKNIPEWAVSEFGRKKQECVEKLLVNRKSIDLQMSELFAMLKRKASASSEVTYH